MTTPQNKPDISVEVVAHFCFERFLGVINENNGSHADPCGAVADALIKEYGINMQAAHSIYRPPYWLLMDKGILMYHSDKGSYWTQAKNDIDVRGLVKMLFSEHGDTMKERVEEAVKQKQQL